MTKTFLKNIAALAVISIAFAFSANTASAGGDIYRAPVSHPTIWQGFYLGGHAGYAKAEATELFFNQVDGIYKDDAMVGGVHGGYNWQHGSVVYGVEADISGTGIEYNYGAPWSAEVNYLASVRARLGYAVNDLLIYGTAGVAWTDIDDGPFEFDLTGFVFGAGAEMKIGQKYSLRGEILNYTFEADGAYGIPPLTVEDDITVVRTGLSIHF